MTIASEITRINTNIANAYTACDGKGATMPATQNSANLATCIGSIQTGSTPTLITKNITANGTYNASSDNADGYSSVTVNVSGGEGGSTINEYANFITIPFNCTFDNMQDAISAYNQTMLNKGQDAANDLLSPNCQSNITLGKTSNDIFHPINLGNSFYIGAKSFRGYLVANATTTENGGTLGNNYVRLASGNYTYITTTATGNLRKINGNVFGNKIINFGALKEIYITNITSGNSVVEAILMPFVEKAVITSNAFYNFTKLKYISLPSLSDLTSEYALGSNDSVYSPFGNSLLKEICFPSLNSSSFGSYTNQFDNMLRGVTGCTVHFPSNLQSVIGSWSSVTSGFGGTNTTVLFDLPATT